MVWNTNLLGTNEKNAQPHFPLHIGGEPKYLRLWPEMLGRSVCIFLWLCNCGIYYTNCSMEHHKGISYTLTQGARAHRIRDVAVMERH